MKSLKVDFKILQVGFGRRFLTPFLLWVDLTMTVYFFLLQLLLIFEDSIPDASYYRRYLIGIYTVLFLIMLVYVNGTFKEKREEEIIRYKERQIVYLSNYSKQIESLYNEIRDFRHDYINILTSLKVAIDQKNLTAIEGIYYNVLSQSGRKLQGKQYNIANLIHVENEAVKSLLSTKVFEAQNKGIDIAVEVEKPFRNPQIDSLDFVTILSILLDNAIEGAESASKRKITVALIAEEKVDTLIVQNSIEIEKVNIADIFSYRYSTKGGNRGIGLYNISNILRNYPHVSLQTQSKNYNFRQTLVIKHIHIKEIGD
ncbi:sensor histidine kinase [Streptococcus pantholopis]|uniref:sensor histidine kinase n=1 Tax=Streptococcus pantholopis TaxID=1811193 RepID=UPI000AF0D16C|nr:GHKL domain-containing protein [Streptococcus pantholopis]